MRDKLRYLFFYIRFGFRKILNRIAASLKLNNRLKVKYDRRVLSEQAGNDYIRELILSDKPFVAGRFGSNELNVLVNVIGSRYGLAKISDGLQYNITQCAGLFPDNRETTTEFGELMESIVSDVDCLGCWNERMEDYIVKYYMPDTKLIELSSIEPYFFKNPWSKALAGKKVLVIHPFADTIQKQYVNREKLFADGLLPDFTLYTLKAVQTVANNKDERFDTWFEALDYMYNTALEFDFDIALVGCGAYGLPLSVKLKQAGKQVVHMGGALQVLFGIKGMRWDNSPRVSSLYNEYWVRPDESEKPADSQNVEGACYW